MNIENDLKEIELKLKKKAFLSFHQDGIIDILIGWDLIGTGFFLYTHSMLFGYLGLAALLFYYPLKVWITLPRLGHAQFRTRPTPSMWVIGGIGGVLLIAAIVYGIFLNSSLGPVGPIALALFGGAFALVLVSGFNRIFAYALLIPLFFVVGLGTGFLSPLMTIGVGAAIVIFGIWMLAKFLRKNPLQPTE